MFAISQNKGFSIAFPNGFVVSVQFGPFNYCANRERGPQERYGPTWEPVPPCVDAEVAVIDANGKFVPMEAGDDVRGWVSPAEVAALLSWASALNPEARGFKVPSSLFKSQE